MRGGCGLGTATPIFLEKLRIISDTALGSGTTDTHIRRSVRVSVRSGTGAGGGGVVDGDSPGALPPLPPPPPPLDLLPPTPLPLACRPFVASCRADPFEL